MGTGVSGYAAEGRCRTFGLNFVFVGQCYDEILINLRGLVLGGNSEGLCSIATRGACIANCRVA